MAELGFNIVLPFLASSLPATANIILKLLRHLIVVGMVSIHRGHSRDYNAVPKYYAEVSGLRQLTRPVALQYFTFSREIK